MLLTYMLWFCSILYDCWFALYIIKYLYYCNVMKGFQFPLVLWNSAWSARYERQLENWKHKELKSYNKNVVVSLWVVLEEYDECNIYKIECCLSCVCYDVSLNRKGEVWIWFNDKRSQVSTQCIQYFVSLTVIFSFPYKVNTQ